MSSSDDSSDSVWSRLTQSSDHKKETKLKPNKIINGDKKYYRQRFVEGWLDRFKPWIARDETDPERSFCKACRRLLISKMCHLKRHERTRKHRRNLQSFLGVNGLLPDRQNLGQRKERNKSVKVSTKTEAKESKFESIYMGIEYIDEQKPSEGSGTQETLHAFQFAQDGEVIQIENVNQASASKTHSHNNLHSTKPNKKKEKSASDKKDTRRGGKNLYLRIQKDRQELMSSFNELLAIEKKDKSNVDLFFEGIISSVKALSPKLIVETKMRICQLICEMELRTIVEDESKTSAASTSSIVLQNVPRSNEFIIKHQQETASGSNQVGSSQNDPS